ncbi:MAG: hypothetical protein ACJ76H_04245 [Bacteriovoracaceae bacterium]
MPFKFPKKTVFGKFLLLFFFTLFIYVPVLGKKTSNPDAQYVLPSLYEISGPGEYLGKLARFETMDFQPVRDLSFFVDLAIYKASGLVTFATTNVLLLTLLAFLFFQLLEKILPEEKKSSALYFALVFAAFPLFSQSVGWGMARKHLLASVFILWATKLVLDFSEGKRTLLPSYLAYVAACLSHPIAILWPVWVFFHLKFMKISFSKEGKKLLITSGVTGILLFLITQMYYKFGNPIHADVYPRIPLKLTDSFRIFLNAGFDLRQIFFPYQLSFTYYPDFSLAWQGLIILVLLAVSVYLRRKDSSYLSWVVFTLMTLPLSLTLPGVYDTYLILPATGVFILISILLPAKKSVVYSALVLALAWGAFTFHESSLWANETKINNRNFVNHPSCQSAMTSMLASYEEGSRADPKTLHYFDEHQCFQLAMKYPPASRRIFLFLEGLMLFYEDQRFTQEMRRERLKFLGERHYYPRLIYAAMLAKENKSQEVEDNALAVLKVTRGPVPVSSSVSENILRPFCQKHQLTACLEVTNTEPRLGYL